MAAVWGLDQRDVGGLSPMHLVSGGIGEIPDMQDVHVQVFLGPVRCLDLGWAGEATTVRAEAQRWENSEAFLLHPTTLPSHTQPALEGAPFNPRLL